jgi:hypothetical protein
VIRARPLPRSAGPGDTGTMHRLPIMDLVAIATALVDIARKRKPKPGKPKKPPKKRRPKPGEQWLDLLWP